MRVDEDVAWGAPTFGVTAFTGDAAGDLILSGNAGVDFGGGPILSNGSGIAIAKFPP